MVEVGVRQDYRVNIARRNGGIFPIALSPFLLALKKTTINEHLHARLVG
jgi:hypothetical protein